jgi:PAS domain S-box-containing protein
MPAHGRSDPDPGDLPSEAELLEAIEGLYSRLSETEGLLRALRDREVDAVLIAGATDPRVFMLQSADHVYRIIIEQMREGAALVSEEGAVLYANRALGRLLGVPPDELLGEAVTEFVDEGFRAVVEELTREGCVAPCGQWDVLLRRPDAGTVPVLVSATDLELEGARIRSLVLTDVTEKRRTEEYLRRVNEELEERVSERTAELNRTVEELRRSNEELQRFAYVASHDLQEPLRSIVSFSQLLERRYGGQLDSDADEFIGFIVEGGLRMQTLITDLLSFSRVTTNGRPFVETDAGAVLGEALHDLRGAIEAEGATVTAGPMPRVMADEIQLGQVFANLIGNALKYRRPGVPPAIRVAAWRVGPMVQFSVQDNGIGIEPEYFDRIFVLFQRLHTKDRYPGTGIGLAVVKKIVERHGGRIRVESEPGRGSTFLFTMPAA